MEPVLIGKTDLAECPKCEGIWADADSLQHICDDRDEQASVIGMAIAQTVPPQEPDQNVRYIPCPVCHQLMNRVNFARCSGVVVDVCGQHGTWFDRDELRRVVEFIRGGGLERAREEQLAELGERERSLRAAETANAWSSANLPPGWADDSRNCGISILATAIKSFFER